MQGGDTSRWHIALFSGWLVLAVLFGALAPQVAQAANPLSNLRDVLSDVTPRAVSITHDISFTLPLDAAAVTPQDYILISLPNFSNLDGPQYVSGGFGTPQFGRRDNYTLWITNVSILPGTYFEIFGVVATNPKADQSFSVLVAIANDGKGSIIRNQSITLANERGPTISVSALVENPNSSLLISGYSSPSAFVTLTANGSVAGTNVADGGGQFSFPMSGLAPGNYTFTLSSSDTSNRSTAQSTLSLFLLASTLTTASNIMLSPSIDLSTPSIHPGDPITVRGSSRPAATVNVFVESPLRNYAVTSGNDGAWSYTIPGSETKNYSPGQYRAYANVQDSGGNQSIVSNTASFTVVLAQTDNNPPPACNISHGDLNCDKKTNLTDFSILLFYWNTNRKVADINGDGKVNLTDFSIMMFYFKF